MGTVLTHPFLCLNRYKQNDRTTYIICYHSAPYSFTNKPEIGGLGADEAWYCQQLCKATCYYEQSCLHCTFMQRLTVASFVSFPAPFSGLLVKLYAALWQHMTSGVLSFCLYLFRQRKGWAGQLPIENLCCTSVLNDTRAEGEAWV